MITVAHPTPTLELGQILIKGSHQPASTNNSKYTFCRVFFLKHKLKIFVDQLKHQLLVYP